MKNNLVKIYLFCAGLFAFLAAPSQQNAGFESGLAQWSITGLTEKVTLDSVHPYEGKYCARIDGEATLYQRFEVSPLSVLEFSFQLACTDKGSKAVAFIGFYDARGHLLLEYKSSPVYFSKYEQVGNYTEAPPFSKYALIGVAHHASDGPVYVDALKVELNLGAATVPHEPLCDLDQYMTPFWKGDTVYNETVLLYSANQQPASGTLLFEPSRVLSVKSFDLQTTFQEGLDFSVSKNILQRLTGSKMPFRADTSFDRRTDLAWYDLQSQWVVVTYVHPDHWNGPALAHKSKLLPLTVSKLRSQAPISMVALGMSITRGLDVSGYDGVIPYMPTYLSLFERALKKKYHLQRLTIYNAGLPGATVDWGADYAAQYVNPLKPDLVIIDFGMNDFWRFTPAQFKDYIRKIIQKVRAGKPSAEFLLLANLDFDPAYILDSDKNKSFYVNNMQGYKTVLKELEAPGIVCLDMTTLSDFIYSRKKAKDCLANPLHPNDYLARWYAQCLVELVIP